MVRAKNRFGAAASRLSNCFRAIPAAAAGALPPAVLLSAAGPGAMVERRVGSRKLLMPAVWTGHKNAQERALVYYATKAILDTECRDVDFDVRLRDFGTIMGQDFVAGSSITDFNQVYEQQLEDPDRFTILSYHDRIGDVINDTCTVDTMVLKPTGDSTAASAPVNCQSAHIKFVTFHVALDFSDLFLARAWGCPKSMTVTTTAEIPQTI